VTRVPEPHPAATVLLLRPGADEPEVLLIHRPSTMAFGPGLHAFPGGRVDPGDRGATAATGGLTVDEAAIALGHNVAPGEALALHVAATREMAEEAGVRLRPADLAPLAHWTTPRFMPRRFSTWFFVADLPDGVEPAFSPDEVASHRWATPRAALDQMSAGEIEMWVPTTSVLQRLAEIGVRTASASRASRPRGWSPTTTIASSSSSARPARCRGASGGRRSSAGGPSS